MKWLEAYNNWSAKVGNRFGDWFFDFAIATDNTINKTFAKYVPAIGMTLVIIFMILMIGGGIVTAWGLTR